MKETSPQEIIKNQKIFYKPDFSKLSEKTKNIITAKMAKLEKEPNFDILAFLQNEIRNEEEVLGFGIRGVKGGPNLEELGDFEKDIEVLTDMVKELKTQKKTP